MIAIVLFLDMLKSKIDKEIWYPLLQRYVLRLMQLGPIQNSFCKCDIIRLCEEFILYFLIKYIFYCFQLVVEWIECICICMVSYISLTPVYREEFVPLNKWEVSYSILRKEVWLKLKITPHQSGCIWQRRSLRLFLDRRRRLIFLSKNILLM